MDKLVTMVNALLNSVNDRFLTLGWYGEALFAYGFLFSAVGFMLGAATGCTKVTAGFLQVTMATLMVIFLLGFLWCAIRRASRLQPSGTTPAPQTPPQGP